MPDRYRERLTELAEMCREIVDALATSQRPPRDKVERFNALVDGLRPNSSFDPFFVTWTVLDSATTFLEIAASDVHDGSEVAKRSALATLRGVILDLDTVLQRSPS